MSALTLIVFGTANLVGVVPNITSISPASGSALPINQSSITTDYSSVSPVNQDSMQLRAALLNYTYLPGIGAYKVFTGLKTWNVARRACEEDGGHMVIINSEAESRIITQLFDQYSILESWVGIHDLYEESSFVTIHGDSLVKAGYDEWMPGEPNNVADAEHCAVLTESGKFLDLSCNTQKSYICELPHVQSCVMQVLGNARTPLPSNIVNQDAV